MVASCRSLAPQAKTQPFVAVDVLCWALHMLLSLLLSRSHWRRRLPTCGSVLCMSGFEQQQVIQHTSFPRPVKSDNRLGRFRLPSVGTPRRCTDGAEPVRACFLLHTTLHFKARGSGNYGSLRIHRSCPHAIEPYKNKNHQQNVFTTPKRQS